jgi:hypothetical protein
MRLASFAAAAGEANWPPAGATVAAHSVAGVTVRVFLQIRTFSDQTCRLYNAAVVRIIERRHPNVLCRRTGNRNSMYELRSWQAVAVADNANMYELDCKIRQDNVGICL